MAEIEQENKKYLDLLIKYGKGEKGQSNNSFTNE